MSFLTTDIPPSACPLCDKLQDRATSIGVRVPEEGDFTVCMGCGGILRFGDSMQLVKCSAQEMASSLTIEKREQLLIASILIRAKRSGVIVKAN